MARGYKCGPMEKYMRDIGKRISKQDMVGSTTLTVTYTKDVGSTARLMAEENIFIRMAQNISENGKTTKKMVMESKYSPTVPHSKETISMIKNKELGNSNGPMAQSMLAST